MKKLLNFDVMIAPLVLKILFWVGSIASVVIGLLMIVQGFTAYYGGGDLIFTGLLTIILGPIMIRVYCELLIIMFKMFDTMKGIQRSLDNQSKVEED